MVRIVRIRRALAITAATGVASAVLAAPGYAQPASVSVKSSPPDRTIYPAPVSPAAIAPAMPAGVFLIDATAAAHSAGGNEPAIAVDPADTSHIAITRFHNAWGGGNADMLFTTDAGHSWTNEATIPAPPGVAGTAACPCDQNMEYGHDGTLYGTFLTDDSTTDQSHVVTGSTSDPTQASAWRWNGNPAQLTSGTRANVDQPWLLVNRDPTTASRDDVYIGYDDFGAGPDARVAVARGATPVNITADNKAGTENPSATNPGLRLATDPRNGAMYALYEQSSRSNQPKRVTYKLNRSTDGGASWRLGGSGDGITVATVNSDQAPGYKFGGVNALLGGVDHAAVDPSNGDVYVVYGEDVSGGNQIKLRRLTPNGSGGLTVGPAVDVSSSTNAALPSVAVTSDGTVGVLYDSFDGNTSAGFPTFTAHLARSTDHGASFDDVVLRRFQSPAKSTSNARQRVLGDYQQMKAAGDTFYGTFAGNTSGVPASNPPIDAIFFSAAPPSGPPPPPPSQLTYTGATSADYHDAFTASATLTAGGSPISGATVRFALGQGTDGEACSATTTTSGRAACTLTPDEAAGSTTVTASFAGTDTALPASTTVPFTILKEETTLAYTGPPRIANGTPTRLTAVLKEDGTVPIDGRTVSIALGSGAARQACEATTDTTGTASCAITPNQPLNATATVPLTATFASDAFYRPSSASATLLLQYMTGRAYGLSANVNLPLVGVTEPPTPDTGPIRTAGALTTQTPCTAELSAIVLSAHALCPKVRTTVNPGTSTATSSVSDATIGIPGLPVIEVSGVTATSASSCTAARGSATLKLTIGGVPVTVPTAPNTTIGLAGGAQLVINQQTPVAGADFGLTVNAVHLTTAARTVDVVIGSARSDAHNCV